MGFKYVLIPASPNDEMQELEYPEDVLTLETDTFRTFIEKYFVGAAASVDRSLLLEQLQQRTGVDLNEEKLQGKDLDRLLSSTSVEIFPVQLPTKEFGFQAVSFYVDDKGIAKGLEVNTRASGLAQACGYVSQEIKGDCFIGRVFDDTEDEWYRVDFTLKDVSTDAAWVDACKQMRSKRSAGDLASLANTVGAKNPAHINPGMLQDSIPKGETEQYSWRQADDEVEITFKKDGLQKGDKKAVKFTSTRQRLKVEVKGDTLIDEELFAATVPDEALWTLSDGVLQVTLTKADADQWPRLLKT